MIALNTYSFAIRMGLLKNKKNLWNFLKFVKFCKKKKLKKIEFPIDYFSKFENKNFRYYFEILERYNLKAVIALENFRVKYIKNLLTISNDYDFEIIRIKMSNFFGGNRYKQKKFNITKKNFIKDLRLVSKIIKKTHLKIAIENHQDLSSKELIEIIRKLNCKNIGITWDIGNSLATCETPDQFFENSKKFIFNVHCKNYKIILSKEGFFLKRSKIHEGSINIKRYINFFKKNNLNLSLELAAHVNRHCDFNNEKFLQYHVAKGKKLKNFTKYLIKNSKNESPFSNWELFKNINLCAKKELIEFNHSLNELKMYV